MFMIGQLRQERRVLRLPNQRAGRRSHLHRLRQPRVPSAGRHLRLELDREQRKNIYGTPWGGRVTCGSLCVRVRCDVGASVYFVARVYVCS